MLKQKRNKNENESLKHIDIENKRRFLYNRMEDLESSARCRTDIRSNVTERENINEVESMGTAL